MKLSVVMPTLNAETTLPAVLAAVVPGAVSGLVRELMVSDGGSTDATIRIVEAAGGTVLTSQRGRGLQLAAGAARARGDWLLFLHADSVPAPGWEDAVRRHMERDERAAVFRFRLDDRGVKPRLLERMVALRAHALALPYGDQGLLISRRLYDAIGGFRPLPIMEDVDIVRRIGRRRLTILDCAVTTSAARYRRDGYARRMARNALCLSLWYSGAAPERIARLYG